MVLQATLQPSDTPPLEILRQKIERTEIVAEETISSLVTIGTRVQFIAHNSHWISEGRLTLPNDVRADHSISILSPLGSAYWGSAATNRSTGLTMQARITD